MPENKESMVKAEIRGANNGNKRHRVCGWEELHDYLGEHVPQP
jgi:hypothetical protein